MDKVTYAAIRRGALANIAERNAAKAFVSADELIDYLREVAVDRHEAQAEIASGASPGVDRPGYPRAQSKLRPAPMVIEHLPTSRASRARRPRNAWPIIISIMVIVAVVAGKLMAQH